METKARKIIVTDDFQRSAEKIAEYIVVNSPQNAFAFSDGIKPKILEIVKLPHAYPVVWLMQSKKKFTVTPCT